MNKDPIDRDPSDEKLFVNVTLLKTILKQF